MRKKMASSTLFFRASSASAVTQDSIRQSFSSRSTDGLILLLTLYEVATYEEIFDGNKNIFPDCHLFFASQSEQSGLLELGYREERTNRVNERCMEVI